MAFLAAPGLVAARFLRGLGGVDTGVVSLGGALITWGLAATLTFAARQAWTPEFAVLTVSVLVGLVSAIDLLRSLRRPREGVT